MSLQLARQVNNFSELITASFSITRRKMSSSDNRFPYPDAAECGRYWLKDITDGMMDLPPTEYMQKVVDHMESFLFLQEYEQTGEKFNQVLFQVMRICQNLALEQIPRAMNIIRIPIETMSWSKRVQLIERDYRNSKACTFVSFIDYYLPLFGKYSYLLKMGMGWEKELSGKELDKLMEEHCNTMGDYIFTTSSPPKLLS